MEGYANLIVEQEGPILWVRLNRPEVLNAYTNELGSELVRAFGQADADDGVKVVVLTATGRVFCAGADVSAGAGAFDTESGEGAKNFGARDLDGRADGSRADSNFVAAMMNCRKPSLVAFNGSAAGVGLTLTLPCDIRIAADSAKFGCVFTRRGLVPEAGSAWFLPRLVGLSTALKWCMTGALVPASEALAVDAALNIALGARGDVREGVSAFLEKRAPDFPLKVSADMPATPWWPDRPDLRN